MESLSRKADGSKQLNRVQRRFLRFAKFILKIPCEPHNYTPVATYFGLSSLAERRHDVDSLLGY